MDYSQGIVRRRRIIPPSQSFFSNTGGSGGAPPSFTFVGGVDSAWTDDGINPKNVSMDIGDAAANRMIVVGFSVNHAAAVITSIVVNGVTLTQQAQQQASSSTVALYSGVVAAGAGSQLITATCNQPFNYWQLVVWRVVGLTSTTPKDTGTAGPNTATTMTVDAGDLMFALTSNAGDGGAIAFTGSTEAPTTHAETVSAISALGGDWTILATNAAFSIGTTAHNDGTVAVSYR